MTRRRRANAGAEDFDVPARLQPPAGWMPMRRLLVPQSIWEETWRVFPPYAKEGVECPVFWHGIENDESGVDVVTTLTIPHAHREPAFYQVPQEETRRVSDAVGEAGVVALAQVHTHPRSYGVVHSPYDDQNALSMGTSFLSLIFPDYGERPCGLDQVGVHERWDRRWLYLTPEQKRLRIRLLPSRIDLRR